jgi:hypothetical protein
MNICIRLNMANPSDCFDEDFERVVTIPIDISRQELLNKVSEAYFEAVTELCDSFEYYKSESNV